MFSIRPRIGHVDLGEHGGGLAGIDEGDFLRGGDDDGAVERDGLDDGELDVAGAGRQVEDQVVEVAPGDLAEELLGVAGGERAADDDRRVVVEQESHRHELDAVGFDRDDVVVLVGGRAWSSAPNMCAMDGP